MTTDEQAYGNVAENANRLRIPGGSGLSGRIPAAAGFAQRPTEIRDPAHADA
jgi:hypothetical protein